MAYLLAWVYVSGAISTTLMLRELHDERSLLACTTVGLLHPLLWVLIGVTTCVIHLVPDSVKRRIDEWANT